MIMAGGCDSKKEIRSYPAEGILTVNGEPAGNASLALHSRSGVGAQLCPVAVTDEMGYFRFSSQTPFDGAPVGEYVVTIVWINHSPDFDECDCLAPLLHDRLKGRYANPDQSPIRVAVRAEANQFRIDAWNERRVEDLLESTPLNGTGQMESKAN